MLVRPTPVNIIESFFNVRLERKSLKFFFDQPEDRWIDFAQYYLKKMKADFAEYYLTFSARESNNLRLYFEPGMSHEWNSAVKRKYDETPVFGLSPYPDFRKEISKDHVSAMLNPLKKHLLLADSLYINDNFYSCFDAVADSVNKENRKKDPNIVYLVNHSIEAIKSWLPILIELRKFIDNDIIIFMPYYITPSFPYKSNAPALKPHMKNIRIRPGKATEKEKESHWDLDPDWSIPPSLPENYQPPEYFSHDEVLSTWLNSRLLRLDPVFPSREMFDFASQLYFADEIATSDFTSDLISVNILPFGDQSDFSLQDLISMRKNEEVFTEIKNVTGACKEYIETNLGAGTTQKGISDACKTFLRDHLDSYDRKSVLRIIDEHPVAGFAYAIALSAMFASTPFAIVTIAGALLTPQLFRIVEKNIDPKRRAVGRLQMLL